MNTSIRRLTPDQLRQKMEDLKISQRVAAARLGINPRTLRRWLAGEFPIPLLVGLDTAPTPLAERLKQGSPDERHFDPRRDTRR